MLDVADSPDAVESLIRRVGQRVRAARSRRGLSRRALSERSGVSPRYLAQLEAGAGNISIGLLQRVALALGQTIEALVAAEEEATAVGALYGQADAEARRRVMRILDPGRFRERKEERVCLLGLRGAGKSTLGALAGADLGMSFVELNDVIERNAGIPAGEIIALYGQEGYRELEADALEDVAAAHRRVILAVAGGIVEDAGTFATLLERFHTIWVTASPVEHMDRVRAQGDTRPMAGNPRAMVQLRQLLRAREAFYREADRRLDTQGRSIAESRADLAALIASLDIPADA